MDNHKLISELTTEVFNETFRIEFRVFEADSKFFSELKNKGSNIAKLALNHPGLDKHYGEDVSFYRKVHFVKDFEDVLFVRIDVSNRVKNKGTVLRKYYEKYLPSLKKENILHIGDQLGGMVDDAIVKEIISGSTFILYSKSFNNTDSRISSVRSTEDDLHNAVFAFISK